MTILLGDCLAILKTLPDASVDCVVTDPPYGLGTREPTLPEIIAYLTGAELDTGGDFMGRDWSIPPVAVWRECLRVLKPGGHLLSFGGTRTFDLISIGLRAAGFENRDTVATQFGVQSLQWVQGQGFPKSLSIFKQLDKEVRLKYGGTCTCQVDFRPRSIARCEDGSSSGQTTGLHDAAGDHEACGSKDPGLQTRDPDCQESGLLDVGVGQAVGDHVGHQFGTATGLRVRDGRGQQATRADDPNFSTQAAPKASGVLSLQETSLEASQARQKSEEAILLKEVRKRGAEETRLGDAPLRSGVESDTELDSETRQSMSSLSEDAAAEQECSACASSEAVSVRREQSAQQLGRVVHELSSSNRSVDYTSVRFDSGDRQPRKLLVDNLCGWGTEIECVCSWCAKPDQEWLNSFLGLGSSLKPSWEPILVYRKPFMGTVAGNVLKHGTGALNIDASRVSGVSSDTRGLRRTQSAQDSGTSMAGGSWAGTQTGSMKGRWPANVLMVHSGGCRVVGAKKVAAPVINRFDDGMKPFGDGAGHAYTSEQTGDSDGMEEVPIYECEPGCPVTLLNNQSSVTAETSRFFGQFEPDAPFFYTSKVSKAERNKGLVSRFFREGMVMLSVDDLSEEAVELLHDEWPEDLPSPFILEQDGMPRQLEKAQIPEALLPFFEDVKREGNPHPTMKPLALMRWLVRLVAPKGSVVLDPYCGSGTTCIAAIDSDCEYIGIERDPLFYAVAIKRIAGLKSELEARAEDRRGREAFQLMLELEQE